MYKYSYRKSQGAVWVLWLLTYTPSFSLFFAPFHWLGCVISCSYHSQSSSFYFQDLLSFWWVIWIFLSLVWLFCADLYFRAGLSINVLILLIMCSCVCVWLEICVRIILIMFSLHLYVKFFLYVKSYVLSSGVRYRYIVMLCSRVIFGVFVREHVNFWSDE